MHLVWNHEQESLIKVADEIEKYYNIKETPEQQDPQQPTTSKAKIKKTMQKNHRENWHKKTMHGYLPKEISEDKEIDHKQTTQRMNHKGITSHLKGFLTAIEEQKIRTRSLEKRREKDIEKQREMNSTCRLCRGTEENIFHIICSCPQLSSSLYLPIGHDQIAKSINYEFKQQIQPTDSQQHPNRQTPPEITKIKEYEIWWNKLVRTTVKIKHTRPDIILWNNKEKTCTIIEICVPLDTNATKRSTDKEDIYYQLVN